VVDVVVVDLAGGAAAVVVVEVVFAPLFANGAHALTTREAAPRKVRRTLRLEGDFRMASLSFRFVSKGRVNHELSRNGNALS
jgi:hypothetical protein